MTKLSLTGFTEFVNTHPSDEVIQHTRPNSFMGDGKNCAMGLYYQSVYGEITQDEFTGDKFEDSDIPDCLYNLLKKSLDAIRYFPTFGDLQKYISTNYPNPQA